MEAPRRQMYVTAWLAGWLAVRGRPAAVTAAFQKQASQRRQLRAAALAT
eukprot:SAG25_NODE_7078_length_507_cov_0.911765_2_plen_48_part_01